MSEEWTQIVEGYIPYGPRLWRSLAEYPLEFVNKVNTIIEFFEFRCLGDWVIYVRTAVPPAGEAVLALLAFDWDDIARGFLRPYGPRSRMRINPHARGRGKHRLVRFEIPEIGELIGKNLPGAKIIKSRPVAWGERLFWVLDEYAQRGLFWWLIMDVVAEFFYEWALGVFRSEECWESPIGYERWECANIAPISSREWDALGCYLGPGDLVKAHGERLTRENLEIGHSQYQVMALLMFAFRKNPAYKWPPYMQLRVVDPDTGWVWEVSPPIPEHRWGVLFRVVPPGRRIQFQWRAYPPEAEQFVIGADVFWDLRAAALPQ